jgi:hypothetical protein
LVSKNRDGAPVCIAQVGWAGIKLGRIDLYLDKHTDKKVIEGSASTISKIYDFV